MTYGEPPEISAEEIVAPPAPRGGAESLQYDDTSWMSLLFRSPLLVYLSLLITEDGTIGDIEVVASSGRREFDEAIANQLKNSQRRFTPGQVRGKPVAMRYLHAASYVPEGKREAFLKKKEAVSELVEKWTQQREAELAELRRQALEEQHAERAAWRERYKQEAPYRNLPTTPVSDTSMAERIFQLRHLLTYCGNEMYHRFEGELYQYAGGAGIVVTQSDLTPLDRINGYEWKGHVQLRYGLWRFKKWSSTQWSDWSYPSGYSPKLEINVEKKKGIWNWPRRPDGRWMTCADISRSSESS